MLFEDFRNVPSEHKKEVGQKLNILKCEIQEKYNSLKDGLASWEEISFLNDLTRPSFPFSLGSHHPISIIRNEIIDIFLRLGFVVSEGPEIEDDDHVFTMLNFASEHRRGICRIHSIFPGCQSQIPVLMTFFFVLHTSSVQVRVMQHDKPPIRTISPGRVFRNEAISARAHCIFHQVEGLYIDENVSFADLKQTLLFFAREMFGKETEIRLRPSYFPFTEPSAEMDVS